MATLSGLTTILFGATGDQGIIQDVSYYPSATERINDAVSAIASGVRMPNGQISPPLPELYTSGTVITSTTLPYKALPATYQRGLFMVSDSSGNQVYPPSGGDYYSFALFVKGATEKDLSQTGSVSTVCVKGLNLYYQGIPSAAETLTVHFYRKPVEMDALTETPDGIPEHLQKKLIKHYVAMDVFGSNIEEDFNGRAYKFHSAKFYETMQDLIDFIGIDSGPMYYGTGNDYVDLGACD